MERFGWGRPAMFRADGVPVFEGVGVHAIRILWRMILRRGRIVV